MTNVIPLFSKRAPVESPCGCVAGRLCYPHRLTNAADVLRAEIAAARRFDAWVMTSELERIARDALVVLDAIADECLPDERNAR